MFTLRDGTVISIPRKCNLSISFDTTEIIGIFPGTTLSVGYTLDGGTSANVVKAFGQGGWIASVEALSPTSGTIKIIVPGPVTDCEVVVIASDGEGYTVLASIDCVQGVVEFQNDLPIVPAEGGEVDIPLKTNLEYEVRTDASWIRYARTKAVRSETVVLSVDANTGGERFARVEFLNDGAVVASRMIFQDGVAIPDAFGFYLAEGNYLYDKTSQYMNLYTVEDQSWFRIVDPVAMSWRELGPLPAGLAVGDTFDASWSIWQEGKETSSVALQLRVRDIKGSVMKLSSTDNQYFVIRF